MSCKYIDIYVPYCVRTYILVIDRTDIFGPTSQIEYIRTPTTLQNHACMYVRSWANFSRAAAGSYYEAASVARIYSYISICSVISLHLS